MAAPAGALTLNAGSSSIKFALFECGRAPTRPVLAGQVEGIGGDGLDHAQALQTVLARVGAEGGGLRVAVVGHRVVHGGGDYAEPVVVDDAALRALRALEPLAPLHQPHNLAGIDGARRIFPGVPQVACFDTAFHRSQPAVQQHFALPARWHAAGVRRYGFHGLSYESIVAQLRADEPALLEQRVVVAHLGNGASMCALRDGRSLATTMSFSPLDGLTMGTRCGRIDAAVVLHLMQHHGLDVAAVGELLYRQSGLLGLSGRSADMRTLLAASAAGDDAARLAIDHFVESALRELAGLAAALRGIDALVFTGGIGENADVVRARIVGGLGWLGARLDPAASARGERRIDADDSALALRVLRTNEEAVIAGHAMRVGGM